MSHKTLGKRKRKSRRRSNRRIKMRKSYRKKARKTRRQRGGECGKRQGQWDCKEAGKNRCCKGRDCHFKPHVRRSRILMHAMRVDHKKYKEVLARNPNSVAGAQMRKKWLDDYYRVECIECDGDCNDHVKAIDYGDGLVRGMYGEVFRRPAAHNLSAHVMPNPARVKGDKKLKKTIAAVLRRPAHYVPPHPDDGGPRGAALRSKDPVIREARQQLEAKLRQIEEMYPTINRRLPVQRFGRGGLGGPRGKGRGPRSKC